VVEGKSEPIGAEFPKRLPNVYEVAGGFVSDDPKSFPVG
jgi:hypothetical protein